MTSEETERQVELKVEREMDRLDARLMNDARYSQHQYDSDVADLAQWAEAQYRKCRR